MFMNAKLAVGDVDVILGLLNCALNILRVLFSESMVLLSHSTCTPPPNLANRARIQRVAIFHALSRQLLRYALTGGTFTISLTH